MTTRATFRIGQLNPENDTRPSPTELAEGIDDHFTLRTEEEDPVSSGTLEYLEKGRNVHVETERDSYNFCYFTYVTDTPESLRVRTDDNEEKEENQVVLETAHVIYFENGQFAFQSRDDIAEAWIPRFIGKRTGTELGGDGFAIDSFDQEDLENAYSSADKISKITFGEPGDESQGISGLGQEMQELAGVTEGLSFSTGQGDGNLKNVDIIDAATVSLSIRNMNIKNGDENTIVLTSSGRIQFAWNENNWSDSELTRNRAQTIRSKLRPYLERVV